jgi:predicted DNA-binding transcriptional regulator AlpA
MTSKKKTSKKKTSKTNLRDDIRHMLLEAYYVVSEFAYDTSDANERENRLHLKQTLRDGLRGGSSEDDMYADLGYVLSWVNGDCFKKPTAWSKLFVKYFDSEPARPGEYSARVCWTR